MTFDTSEVDRVISRQDTAQVLNLSLRTIDKLIADKKLRAVKISTRRTGVFASEIRRYQAQAPSAA